jgi:hypothetical protein
MVVRGLTAAELLDVWERGQDRPPVEQVLLLLALCTGMGPDALAALSIGRRDALLLHTRRQTFGDTLAGWAECPECRERLEFATSVGDLLPATSSDPDELLLAIGEPEHFDARVGELDIRMRAPNSLDVMAIGACADGAAARRLLVERCVVCAQRGAAALSISDLGEEVVAQIAAQTTERDPLSETLLDTRCPACGARWQALFDIATFFWQELAAQAQRLLREVHLLARAYGWREADTLALSARRRQSYIELIEGG